MKILNNYIYQQFTRYFITIFVIAIIMVWLTQSLRFVELITARGVSLYIFMKITLQLIMPMVYIILPVAVFIATLALLYHLYLDREIVILRNAGLSNWQIIKPIIHYCMWLAVIHYAISFYFLPKSYRDFKDSKEYYKNKFVSLLLEEGVFNTQSSYLTVYIDEKVSENYFKGIFIHDRQKAEEAVTIIAESGYIIATDAGPEFVLYNGSHQKKSVKNDEISLATFNSYKFSMHKYEGNNTARALEANELYLHQLFASFNIASRESRVNLVNGTQRLLWPLYTIFLPLIAGAAILFGQFSRKNALKKVSMASFLGIIFIVLSMLFNSLATKHFWLIIFMFFNVITVISFSAKLLQMKQVRMP